jgi:Tol biopolymer transport system component
MAFFLLPCWPRRHTRSPRPRRPRRRQPLRVESLEERTLLAARPLTLADPSFQGDAGRGTSSAPSISADGQRVVFQSDAPNLVPNDTNGVGDVFLYDRGTGRVSLLDVTPAGTAPAEGASDPVIAPDGTHVVFLSSAANLDPIAPAGLSFDALHGNYVYVRDLVHDTTTLASISPDGTFVFGGASASVSDDGTGVAFSHVDVGVDTHDQVYVCDLLARRTLLVSQTATGAPGDDNSYDPVISGNGQAVVFLRDAHDLTANYTGGFGNVYERNLATSQTTLVTATPDDKMSADGSSTLSRRPVSADGR